MKTIYLLSVFFLSWLSVSAQGTIRGTIRDAETKEKLPGVSVYLPELQKGTVSDTNGYYTVRGLPRGNYQIQFSFLGYRTEIYRISLNRDTIINVQLSHAAVESHEVVISGGFYTYQHESPLKIDNLTAGKISTAGASSLSSAITAIPGVDVISSGPGIGKPVIRGLTANRILVMNEGVRYENQQWGDEHGMGISDMGVERVEVVKGPASLLYGSDAMGGVINIIDERPVPVDQIKAEGTVKYFSNTRGMIYRTGIMGAKEKLNWNLRGGYQSHQDYTGGEKQYITNSRFSERSIKSGITFLFKNAIIKSGYQYNFQKLGIVEADSASVLNRQAERFPAAPYQDVSDHIFSVQQTYFLKRVKMRLNLGYQHNQRVEIEEENGKKIQALDMRLGTGNYDLKLYFSIKDRTELIAGSQGILQQNRNAGEEMLIPDAEQNDVSGFAVIKSKFKKTNMQAGLRYDYRNIHTREAGIKDSSGYFAPVSASYGNLSGSAGASVDIAEYLLLRINAALGYRAPSLPELTSNGTHEGTNRYEIGNAALKSEQNAEADLGVHFHREHFSVEVSAFQNHINNYIYISPVDSVISGENVFRYVQANSILKGGELAFDFHPHPFDWLHIESTFSYVEAKRSDVSWLPLIPPLKMTNELRFEKEKWRSFSGIFFFLRLKTAFNQKKTAGFETASGMYSLLDAGAGFRSGKNGSEWMLVVNNMLDRAYIDHLSRFKQDGWYNQGRNFMLGIKIPLILKSEKG